MNILTLSALSLVLMDGAPVSARPAVTPARALDQYCEPLLAGSTSAQLTKIAKADGFKADQVGGNPVLIDGELILSLSDAPRVCFIQAPASMTFAQGIALIDAWATRHPDAMRGAATKGPDGAPVRMWAVPKQRKYLLVTEQTNPHGQKVLNFILAPMAS